MPGSGKPGFGSMIFPYSFPYSNCFICYLFGRFEGGPPSQGLSVNILGLL